LFAIEHLWILKSKKRYSERIEARIIFVILPHGLAIERKTTPSEDDRSGLAVNRAECTDREICELR
jgi:hypothetical protein